MQRNCSQCAEFCAGREKRTYADLNCICMPLFQSRATYLHGDLKSGTKTCSFSCNVLRAWEMEVVLQFADGWERMVLKEQ